MSNQKKTNIADEDLLLFTKLFSEFDKTSLGLRQEYTALTEKVDNLLLELDEKNQFLEKIFLEQKETNNLLYSILESMVTGVIVFNLSKEIIIINKRATEILQIPRSEAIGLPYKEIINISSENTISIIERQIVGEDNIESECELEVGKSEKIPVLYKASTMFDEDGNPRAYIHMFDDLTGVKDMEENIRKNRNLSEIGRMAAGIAHEIRNPLGGISGYATMLARDLKDNPDQMELVDQIKKGVKSLNDITSEILAYTRPMKITLLSLPIIDILAEVKKLVSSEMDQLGLTYKFHFEKPDFELEVDTDYQIIQRVLINLFRNGFQSVPYDRDPELGLKLSFNLFNNYYEILISDNGSGIEETNLVKLFTPFFTTKAEGTGLGLALVKKMIESLNGKISVESKVDKGTIFKLKFPIKRDI
ncbi:MAG: hypothetical protein CR982_00410 [Candidatus Cloacimonadota bacterium]|nr:MAG: hypothetical protein CR982_00410 [Candidatus Cloacimonadota bacterium]PIE78762.1 MAG: hypothetical protein CSA15_06170 [Candidatus Delongbacteria bacterium]